MRFRLGLGSYWNDMPFWMSGTWGKRGIRGGQCPHRRLSQRPPPVPLSLERLETRITPSGPTLFTLASFNGGYGTNPQGSLVEDTSDNLFGMIYGGGAYGYGTLFEVATGTDTVTTPASFNGTIGYPIAGLVADSRGNLFGTTDRGGASNLGTVFEVPAGSSTIITLASFNGTRGAFSQGLIVDSRGNLFGILGGTVFEVPADSGTVTTLASFSGHGTGFEGSLVEDRSGNLFGTTATGGASNLGTVFELPAGSSTITTLASFNSFDEKGGLVEDKSGNLFGTTVEGRRAAAPSLRWPPSMAPTEPLRLSVAWSRTAAAISSVPLIVAARMATARCLRCRRAAAPSPRWPPSTAVTGPTP